MGDARCTTAVHSGMLDENLDASALSCESECLAGAVVDFSDVGQCLMTGLGRSAPEWSANGGDQAPPSSVSAACWLLVRRLDSPSLDSHQRIVSFSRTFWWPSWRKSSHSASSARTAPTTRKVRPGLLTYRCSEALPPETLRRASGCLDWVGERACWRCAMGAPGGCLFTFRGLSRPRTGECCCARLLRVDGLEAYVVES